MIWIDNIQDLQYYHPIKGVPCYCEDLTQAVDLMLQGNFSPQSGNYTLTLYVYSPDGLTQHEDATSYFRYYFFVNPQTGKHVFNAQLLSFSPKMCSEKCFIIRAVVTEASGGNLYTYFDKWTERYCVNDCCQTVSGVTYAQADVVSNVPTDAPPVPANTTPPTGQCGQKLIRIVSRFDCYDAFTGDYYETPDDTLSGTASFAYSKVTTIEGRIVRRPRNIEKQVSYNCVIQRIESTPQYLLEGMGLVPSWKMAEIENQLHATEIWIDDFYSNKEYKYNGGTPFIQVNRCFELFKLAATMEECTQRQIVGCGDPCQPVTSYGGYDFLFVIPENFNGFGFYDESKNYIADDIDNLIVWLRGQDGITAADEVITSPTFCNINTVIGVSGTGYIPTFIYYDQPFAAKRIYSKYYEDVEAVCASAPDCGMPDIDEYTITETACDTPTIGSITVTDITSVSVDIVPTGDWAIQSESGSYFKNQTTFSLTVRNFEIVPTGEGDELIEFVLEPIGILDSIGRPFTPVSLDNSNSNLGENQYLSIDEYGVIRYTGEPTTYTAAAEGYVEIALSNIVFNVQ